ncbi:putative 11-oxo-beta-amyrin 30-oxidase [Lupinus albus]|uniref:Putative 11-oxo-beta-amyrin 30-oxidase n=1 Tax=Lupinus albus TaxID=3870 RepID=A0A6A4N929_LUPAL|nr:putative 11-oxo-beta-amyrin 30-oxidase [Lupinus albus]
MNEKRVNSLWLRPKRLEKMLRSQGLQGDPYKLFGYNNNIQQQQHKSTPFTNQVAPYFFFPVHQTVNKYGKHSFLWDERTPKVIITDPKQIKEIFNKMDDFTKPELGPIGKLLGTGLPFYEGQKWANHRKIINPAFHIEKLKDMVPAFFQSCHDMISKWEEMLSSEGTCEIDVFPFLENMTRDAISRTAFGSSYEEGTKVFELLKMMGYLLMNRHISWFQPTSTKTRKMKEIERDINTSVEAIIKKRESAMKNGEAPNKDLLDILLKSNHNEKNGMTNQEVIEECRMFHLAGYETTSVLLVWTMILLAKFPEWQERAREEVLQVFGTQNPNFEGLNHLKIVSMILYEVLRLYPPTIYFNRVVKKDVKLGNLTVSKGMKVSIPILLIHHDHDLWGDDAKEFKPERFSEGIAKATKGQVSFFPFGWGPRICIGQNFTLLEAKVMLSLLLRNFSFQLSPTYLHDPIVMQTLKPKHGASIILHKL